jgi:hypothetical protein
MTARFGPVSKSGAAVGDVEEAVPGEAVAGEGKGPWRLAAWSVVGLLLLIMMGAMAFSR